MDPVLQFVIHVGELEMADLIDNFNHLEPDFKGIPFIWQRQGSLVIVTFLKAGSFDGEAPRADIDSE